MLVDDAHREDGTLDLRGKWCPLKGTREKLASGQ